MLKFAKGKEELERIVDNILEEGSVITFIACSDVDNFIVVYKGREKESEKDK